MTQARGAAAPADRAAAEAQRLFLAGLERQRRGAADEALALYRRALELDPGLAPAYNNLAILLKGRGQAAAAAACLSRALAAAEPTAALYSNLGNLLWTLDRFAEAEDAFARALALEPERPETLHNLALLRRSTGDGAAAIACFERALQHPPADAALADELRWDYALALLAEGDFARGFAQYETRWRLPRHTRRVLPIPEWRGESLAGKSLLVQSEQGLGDTIQFVRYLPALARLGARVTLACPGELLRLLTGMPGVERVIAMESAPPPLDYHLPLLSLPHRLGATLATIPPAPYLAPPAGAEGIAVRRPKGTRLAIGLVWAGRPEHRNDARRSMPLDLLLRLAELPRVALASLQKGPRAGDIAAAGAAVLIEDVAAGLGDFADTAAVLRQLDLVVGVDTAALHLAGALGRPGFLMLPFAADWRWLSRREDTPWYPSLRLFRQTAPGDWAGVVERVRAAVAERAAAACE